MAAIKPHLALDNEASESQKEYWRCSSSGLGDVGDDACPTPQEIANEAHAELMNTAWIRSALIERMQGRQLWIEYDNNNEPSIAIDQAVKGPAWNPSGGAKRTTILGWTTKMGAPSFSLPAGAPAMGGACSGAIAGQTISKPKDRQVQAPVILGVLNGNHGKRSLPMVNRVSVASAVCEFCYAEGGQYSTSGVQNAQLMRFAWAKRAVQRPGHQPNVSEFYSVMLDAIKAADFKTNKEPEQYGSDRFFRIHDSGDFFSPEYLREWKRISLYYHPVFGGDDLVFGEQERGDYELKIKRPGSGHPRPIYFWAPTRMWAVGRSWVDLVVKVNGLKIGKKPTWDNFSIRPSAYQINQHGPFIEKPGWSAPSTVYAKGAKAGAEGVSYDWDCLAYAVEKGPSCRGAESPEGQEGCRSCWKHQDKAVNYTLHL